MNAIALHRQEGDISYVDFTSLYPWVCKYGLFPLGHPSVFYKDDIPDRVQGLLKCSHFYHPLLPARINSKLMFVLCRTCGEEGAQGDCTHTDEERALTGRWVSLEINKALALGYRMVTKYAAWHFKETMQYKDGIGGLWAEYIDLWLKFKQEASGYPNWCMTEELKKQYVADYQCHEGFCLSAARIVKIDGLRSLCKIMLNSHWGKFGQNPNKSKVTYVSDPAEYVEMLTDDTIEVTDLMYTNKERVVTRWCAKVGNLDIPLPTQTLYSWPTPWLKPSSSCTPCWSASRRKRCCTLTLTL